MPTSGGWTGRTLRVNLSTGTSTVENTLDKYKDFWGGAGMGYKVLWDEVPAGTKPFDPENKLIFGWGPLTGTGAPCGGRTAITSLSPQHPKGAVATGHMGGHFSAEAKYAGWDGIIVEGKSKVPVYIAIRDSKVEIVPCPQLWGSGIYRATAEIVEAMGGSCQVAAIGQAGENLVAQSVIMTNYSHSAGGLGGVMGSKNLKAIGVVGTGSVQIAASKKAWRTEIDFALSIIGSNNQAVVPNSPQPWAEYVGSSSVRWYAAKGKFWGAANPPVETGICDPHDRQSLGLRCFKSDGGTFAEQFTVRMDGCHACPIRCHQDIQVPSAAKWGVDINASNTCTGWWGNGLMANAKVTAGLNVQDAALKILEMSVVGKHMTDDFGLHNNYGTTDRGWKFIYDPDGLGTNKGVKWIQPNVPVAEWTALNAVGGLFDLYEKGDLNFIKAFGKMMATQSGELGKFLAGPVEASLAAWEVNSPGLTAAYHADNKVLWWANGFPKHHSLENGGIVGGLINTGYNRDAQNHSWNQLMATGLPNTVLKGVITNQFKINGYTADSQGGSYDMGDAYDPSGTAQAPTRARAVAAKWAIARKELCDATGLCNWMYPWVPSPLRERGYNGDIGIEAKMFSLATGVDMTTKQFDDEGIRMYILERCLTMRTWGTKDMRHVHDTLPPWGDVANHAGKVAYDGSNYYVTAADWEIALDYYYDELGFDRATGAPTRATLEAYGMKDVADELATLNLLP